MWFKIILILVWLFSLQLQAAPLARQDVPEPLAPWVDWVLFDQYDQQCPFNYNNYQQKRCIWPSRLDLDLSADRGDFSMQWKVYAPSWVTLPGDGSYWPQQVKVNNKPGVILLKHGRPSVFLESGTYHIEGRFFWDFLPETLSIPNYTGLVKLAINEQAVAFPYIKQGRLWLSNAGQSIKAEPKTQDHISIQVFRKVIDEVPLKLLTRIELNVSGKQRELSLRVPMPKDFLPLQVQSPLPARLEKQGQLILQVRPGRWHIDLLARSTTDVTRLPFQTSSPPWPDSEIWVFEAKPYLRVVEIEQLPALDPQQTNLPSAWRQLPAYRISSGETMVFNVIRQGDPEPEPNKLTLHRQLWLDFNGDGITVNDKINGTMSSGWRLDVMPEMQLGRASLDGQNQLITHLKDSDQQGIEVRRGHLQVAADSRIDNDISTVSATGWQQTFNHVDAVLNLPPGWRLFAANGVDNVPQSWISRWTLLDLFLVLIVALAIGRMWNWQWGLILLAGLAMLWHEPGAPRFIWLNLTAVLALLKVLPEGRFYQSMKIYRNLSFAALILISIPFMIDQVRFALYPQLQMPWQSITVSTAQSFGMDQTASVRSRAAAPVAAMEEMAMDARQMVQSKSQKASRLASKTEAVQAVNFNHIDPKARIQTGPGLPQWQWQRIDLSWNGPVDSGQEISFWLISPFFSILLNLLRVVIVVVLSLFMFGLIDSRFKLIKPNAGLLSLLLLLPVLAGSPPVSAAGFPDTKLLTELQNRLLKAPECLPGCVEVEHMAIDIKDQSLRLTQMIHASSKVAVPLPAKTQNWFPVQVLIDNNSAKGLYRDQNGNLIVSLEPGRHQVELIGKIPARKGFTIALPLPVHRVTVSENQAWEIDGLHEHGRVDQQIQFTRVDLEQDTDEPGKTIQAGELPQFFQLRRTLQLGLDWRIENRILRQSAADRPATLEIPLLQGESIITDNIRLQDGKAEINLAAGQNSIVWHSVLQQSGQIQLTAADTDRWVEVWRADISPVWHLDVTGIAVVHHQDKQGRWLPEWRPWPGQQVDLRISRPEAVPGQTLTVDQTRIQFKPGKRNREVSLSMQLRSSQGMQHTIQLPENAQLQSVTIDTKTQPIRQKQNQVTLPIRPGEQHITLNWLDSNEISSWLSTPEINIGLDSVNSHIEMLLGQDRWVLLTFGPRFGPAVLFWGVLLVLAGIAFGLSRIPLTPLKHWQWLLLLIGLSQVQLVAAGIVVSWLMLLGLRDRYPVQQSGYFNAAQVGLGAVTILSLVILFIAVQQGLLGAPEMQITGNQSTATHLNWYQDHSGQQLLTASVISLPVFVYRLLMLAWSLWLAVSLLNWLKWGWQCYSKQGLWKKYEPEAKNLFKQSDNQDQSKP